MQDETVIISLGGSLIVPDEVDVEFLKSFRELILSEVEKGKKFILITGGGKTCRRYQSFAKEIVDTSTEDLDWIGIATNNLNAELLRVVFKNKAHSKVIQNLAERFSLDKPIVIGGAYEPGHSSDYDALLAAINLGARKIINLSNTDYVYDSDPKKNSNAKKLENISWSEYRKLIPEKWSSGLNTPFDPKASRVAEEEGITVMTMNGKPIDNLRKALAGEQFQGTTIS